MILNLFFLVLLIVNFLFVLSPAVVEAKILPVGCSENALIIAINQANSAGGANTLDLAERCAYTIDRVNNVGELGDNGLPQITSDITVNGNNAIILRGDEAPEFRLFQVNDGAALGLKEITLRKGRVAIKGDGGAVYVLAGALTLTGCTLEENDAGCGGAVYNTSGTVTITDTVFTGNIADS